MKAEISIILGKRGSGKTTLCRQLISKSGVSRIIIVDTLGEYGKGRTVVKNPIEFIAAAQKKRFNIAVQFESADDGYTWSCRVAGAVGNLLLVCEEVDWYVKANYAPLPISLLVRYGRHRGVAMLCISRRPPEIWRNLTANADKLYTFHTQEPRDIKYLSQFMGRDAERLAALKPFHYMVYENGKTREDKL